MIREEIPAPASARTGPATRGADPRADVLLDPDIVPAAPAPSAPRRSGSDRRVLLTGATGFLGAFLLRELLDRTDDDVWCLVRADTPSTRDTASRRRCGATCCGTPTRPPGSSRSRAT